MQKLSSMTTGCSFENCRTGGAPQQQVSNVHVSAQTARLDEGGIRARHPACVYILRGQLSSHQEQHRCCRECMQAYEGHIHY